MVLRAILFLTHVLLYTLFVLSQVVCKQFVSIFLSLLENDERCAEWNTTIILFTLEHAFKTYKIYGTYMLQRKGALSTLP